MARSPVAERLAHMLDAIDAILAHTRGKSFDDYQEERILRDAVERNVERLSEASRHIPDAAERGRSRQKPDVSLIRGDG